MKSTWLPCLLGAAILCSAPPARADESLRALGSEAQAEYDLAHFRKSLELFEQLYRLKPVSAVLFNIAQCHRRLGELKEAADTYHSFLVNADPQSREAERAKELLAEVESAISSQHGAVEATPKETAPLPHREPVEAKPAAAATPPPRSVPAPPAAVIVVRAAAPPPRSHVPAYVVGGVGAVALVTGIVFGLKSKSAKSDLDGESHPSDQTNSLISSYQSGAKIADILFAASGLLGLAAVIVW